MKLETIISPVWFKPKDFVIPFSWEERRPHIGKQLFIVPHRYTEHHLFTFPKWNDPLLFGNDHPVFIEFCSGNGEWICDKAKSHPEYNWVAVEIQFDRARKIWLRSQNFYLPNLVTVYGEGMTFAQHYVCESSVDGIYINFPDPWPKTKHAKNRIIQAPFVEQLSRITKPQGKAVLVTDDADYSLQMIRLMSAYPNWKSDFADPFYVSEWPNYGGSFFDALWRGRGLQIRYHQFNNQKS